ALGGLRAALRWIGEPDDLVAFDPDVGDEAVGGADDGAVLDERAHVSPRPGGRTRRGGDRGRIARSAGPPRSCRDRAWRRPARPGPRSRSRGTGRAGRR